MATPARQTASIQQKLGLAFWMEDVLQQCERAGANFEPDPVHDLRVALRRCRSIADGFSAIDPNPSWKEMKKAGKRLFSSLGELRDVQIMQRWTEHFGHDEEATRAKLMFYLASREAELKVAAAQALQQFDRKQWKRWSRLLPRRAARARQGSLVFKHLALERWTEAYELHQRALRNRSQVSLHNLRIGIKRFRYLVENFLPQQHAAWKDDLKELQDLLGEIHDFDVLWATAVRLKAFSDGETQTRWRERIHQERELRIARYREKMMGPASLWQAWRAELPEGKQIELGAWKRLNLWASALDPNIRHGRQVMRLSLELYDGLCGLNLGNWRKNEASRRILRAAALLHDVGRSRGGKAHPKVTYRLICRLGPPLGWRRSDLELAAAIARYHCGALPQARQKPFRILAEGDRREGLFLAGILRLANAFDAEGSGRIGQLRMSDEPGHLVVAAEGYSSRDKQAEGIAAARHLLEIVMRRPIMVKGLVRPRRAPASVHVARKPS